MTEFFSMGGYGFYVWSSMGMVLLLMSLEPIYLRFHHKRIVRAIQRQNRRKAARTNGSAL
ncbi:MAG: heme exporter protein CcmD [Proteobacteria bacterium]|nr:MAG: heme exporter protein CcmD [Pseudomonadota bacterium]